MDNRKWLVSADAAPPAAPAVPSAGYPRDTTPPTVPGAWWYHCIGEEQRAVLIAAGLTPDINSTTQLRDAILILVAVAQKAIVQPAQAFNAGVANGDAVRWDNAATHWKKAVADGTSNNLSIGFADVTNSKVYQFGLAAALFSGLTPNARYYLDATTPGVITTVKPSDAIYVGTARTATDMFVDFDPTPASSADIDPMMNGFRLTLTTAVPVTDADVTAAGTLYWTPHAGNKVALYVSGAWAERATTEKSVAVPAAANQMYAVYAYNNAGTPALELQAWTNDTNRATALSRQDGVLVKSGDPTRRWVGDFRTIAASQTEDSVANRYLSNACHRVRRAMKRFETTGSWAYGGDIRQANGSGSNQLNFICSLPKDVVSARVRCTVGATGNGGGLIALGLDSTAAIAANSSAGISTNGGGATTQYCDTGAEYVGLPGIGKHYLAWLEDTSESGTTTFLGTGNGGYGTAPPSGVGGMLGEIWS